MAQVPKRSSERRRRNKDSAVQTAHTDGTVQAPAADESWHPIARRWFDSLGESGQAQFYEPSDWAQACYIAEAMSRNLEATRFSSQLFAAVMSGMTELLTTEGARRRARIEIERGEVEEDKPGAAIDDYRQRIAAA